MSPGLSKLSPEICRIVDQLRGEALVPLHVLAGELAGYTNELDKHVGNAEFYDLDTALRAATLCHKLLAALPEEPDKEQHRSWFQSSFGGWFRDGIERSSPVLTKSPQRRLGAPPYRLPCARVPGHAG